MLNFLILTVIEVWVVMVWKLVQLPNSRVRHPPLVPIMKMGSAAPAATSILVMEETVWPTVRYIYLSLMKYNKDLEAVE